MTTPARIVDASPAAAPEATHTSSRPAREAQAQDDGANNCNEERSVDHRVTAVAEEHGEHEDRGGRGDGLGHRPESERSPVGEHRSPPERKPCRGDEAPEGLYRCLLEFEGVPRRFEVGAQQISVSPVGTIDPDVSGNNTMLPTTSMPAALTTPRSPSRNQRAAQRGQGGGRQRRW